MIGIDGADGLARLFDLVGVGQIFGVAVPGLEVTVVVPSVAATLAAADAWVYGRPAAASLGDGRFVIGRPDHPVHHQVVVEAVVELVDAATEVRDTLVRHPESAVGLEVRVALAAPVATWAPAPGAAPDRWREPPAELVEQVRAAERPMVVAGPGVVTAGAVPGLQALAAAADLGVLNTWGAKGVFDWRSRHHWATVGLQADDLDRGGVADSDLVVLTGIDPDELDLDALADLLASTGGAAVTVDPGMLAPLSEHWSRPAGGLEMPPLRDALAAVTQAGWARTHAPLAPTKVTAHYAEAVGGAGLVAAAPGRAGYWVARTFATTVLGGARVPARRQPRGLAVACAIVTGRPRPGPGRPLVVVDGPLDDTEAELLDAAEALGIPVVLELWDPDGPALDAEAHRSRLAAALASPRSSVLSLATDRRQLDEMIVAAGPVTAWGGLTSEEMR
jgi:hypothetical protein